MVQIDELASLIGKNYGVQVIGTPELLNEREGQQVFKLSNAGGALTLRLCPPDRPYPKIVADTGALLFLNQAGFAAPHLRLTLGGERAFEWEKGAWAYVCEYIPGQNVQLDLPTLRTLGGMLATLHNLAHSSGEYPMKVNWLEDRARSTMEVEQYVQDPNWGRQAAEVAQTLGALPDLTFLPQGLLHTDVHEGNFLRDPEGGLWLLDWEDAGLGQMVLDIALVLGWYCVWPQASSLSSLNGKPELYDFDEEWCRDFLGNYQLVRSLTPLEAQNLGAAIKFVTGWFAARDIGWEIQETGSSEGEAWSNWAIMRSVTPEWERTLARWAEEVVDRS